MNEFIETHPDKATFTRKLCKNNLWIDQGFVEMFNLNSLELYKLQEWLKSTYGPAKYNQTWWPTYHSICMQDKMYIHYQLWIC